MAQALALRRKDPMNRKSFALVFCVTLSAVTMSSCRTDEYSAESSCPGAGGSELLTLSTEDWPDCPSDAYTLVSDLAYAAGAQKLDVYLPKTGQGPFPTVVWSHGGGWQS